MSFQVGTSCYSDSVTAARAAISAENGRQVVIDKTAYVYQIDGIYPGQTDQTASISATYKPLTAGTSIDASFTFRAEPCGLLETVDGVLIAWAIAAAWIAVYSISFLQKGIHE